MESRALSLPCLLLWMCIPDGNGSLDIGSFSSFSCSQSTNQQINQYLCPMPRILAIDYGLKRTGIAVTDPLKIIATGLTTIESQKLFSFLKSYFEREEVELVLIGEPKNWDESDTHATPLV